MALFPGLRLKEKEHIFSSVVVVAAALLLNVAQEDYAVKDRSNRSNVVFGKRWCRFQWLNTTQTYCRGNFSTPLRKNIGFLRKQGRSSRRDFVHKHT